MGKISNILTAPQKTNRLDWEFGVGRGGLGLPRSLTTHHLLGRSSSRTGIGHRLRLGKGFYSKGALASPPLGLDSNETAQYFQQTIPDGFPSLHSTD